MLKRKWPVPWVVAVVALGALALAACGGAAEPTVQPTPTTGPAVAATPTPTPGGAVPAATPTPAKAQPQYGGEFRFQTTSPRIGQEQLTGTGTGFAYNWGVSYSALLRYEMSLDIPSLTYVVIPDLVERWENPNPTTYIFYLDRDARWQDHPKSTKVPGLNGRPFTAQDAVFGIERLRGEGSAHRGYWAALGTVEATDAYTIKLTLKQPQADFLSNVAYGFNKMVSPEAVKAGGGTLRDGPTVGTGGWIVECEVDVQCVFYRNPAHHVTDADGNQVPYLDRKRNVIVEDVQARFAALRSKQLDFEATTPEQKIILERQYPQVNLLLSQGTGSTFIHFRTDKAPWSDERVRMAVQRSIDQQEIWDTLYDGGGWYTLAMTMPSEGAFLPQDEMARATRRDVAEAKKLLADAGYPKGLTASFWVANYAAEYVAVSELMQQQMKEAGINIELYIHDRPTYLTRVFTRHGDFPDMAYGPQGTFTADQWLLAYYHSQGGRNSSYVNDAVLDKMIEDQSAELDPEKRKQILLAIQRRLLEKNYQIVVRSPISYTAIWPWVQNYTVSAGSDYPGTRRDEYIWIDKALYAQYK